MTAVYKGTPKNGSPVMLRSYDSRKEPAPEFNCTIWEAGRATCATGLAFKPIQIGQSVFMDEGAGKFNPAITALEEAFSEWPAREVGVFVSVGTGKRPEGSSVAEQEWWEGFLGGSMGMFAEARRRLITKIEACETTHQQILKTELPRRGIPNDTYYRFNATSSVGSVGMNEWSAVSTIQTNTRKYLKESDTQRLLVDAAVRMGKIEVMKRRQERRAETPHHDPSWPYRQNNVPTTPPVGPVHPGAVELPADDTMPHAPPHHFRMSGNPPYPDEAFISSQEKFAMIPGESPPPQHSGTLPFRGREEKFVHQPAYPSTYNPSEPPPRPPKTPINAPSAPVRLPQHTSPSRPNAAPRPPYPDYDDGPPPIVSKLRKPEFTPR